MIHRIIADSVTTAAKRMVGTIGNASGNGLLVSIRVSGSGHLETDFEVQTITASIRQTKGETIPLVSGLRILDCLKISDFKGGFSADGVGAAHPVYTFLLPIGRIRLDGDDVLDVAVQCPGDTTAVYAYVVALADLANGPDVPLMHELITGTGAEQLIQDVNVLYLVSNPTGATISVKDEAGKSYNLIDNDIVDLANCLGEMESYEEIGVIFTDPYEFSQDIRVKLPASTYAVAVRSFFDVNRLMQRSRAEGMDSAFMFDKIRVAKADKARFLEMLGKGA